MFLILMGANDLKTTLNSLVLLSRWERNLKPRSASTEIVPEPVRHTVEM